MSPESEPSAIPHPLFHDSVVRGLFSPAVHLGQAVRHPIESARHHQIWTEIRIGGRDNLRSHVGPLIMAMVHRSGMDPLVASVAANKTAKVRINMMAKKEIWDAPVIGRPLGHVLEAGGTFPIDRSKWLDQDTVGRIGKIFKRGGVLGIFPEEHRREGDIVDPKHLKPGTAALALQFGVPIMPVGLAGTHDNEFGPVGVVFGEKLPVWEIPGLNIANIRTIARSRKAIDPLTESLGERMQIAQDEAISLRQR